MTDTDDTVCGFSKLRMTLPSTSSPPIYLGLCAETGALLISRIESHGPGALDEDEAFVEPSLKTKVRRGLLGLEVPPYLRAATSFEISNSSALGYSGRVETESVAYSGGGLANVGRASCVGLVRGG